MILQFIENNIQRNMRSFSFIFFLLLPLHSIAAASKEISSNIGIPGTLNTPSAIFPAAGSISAGASLADPYNTLFLNFQPFSWLNVGTRYTDITDRPYVGSRTGQSSKDKSFDFSVRFYEGGKYIPSISLGIIDIGGTGLFASEYFVASKETSDFTGSVGLGWGRLGNRGDFKNPAIVLDARFSTRPVGTVGSAQGGAVSARRWFRGEQVAVFGSVLWHPVRWPQWTALVELDGNAYTQEAAGQPIDAKSRVNFGLARHFNKSGTATISYLRGDTLSFQLQSTALLGHDRTDSRKPYLPTLQKNRHPVYRREPPAELAAQFEHFYTALQQQGYFVHSLDLDPTSRRLTIWQSNTKTDRSLTALQFIGRTACNTFRDRITTVRVITLSGGLEVSAAEATVAAIEDEASDQIDTNDFIERSRFEAESSFRQSLAQFPNLLKYPTIGYGINPALRSNVGGPTHFYAGQLLLKPYSTVQITQGWSLTGTAAINLINGLDNLQRFTSGTLPPVRSEIELYQQGTGPVYIDQLETNYFFPVATDWFGRVSAGIFEEMYGGGAAEILYRPYSRRWALSLNANYVVKRDYNQLFSFQKYRTATGHLTLFYKTPFNGLNIKASVGRYLAKDVGASLDLSREFANGTRMGVYATKTNVSAAEFGEGSFDKGFYIQVPLSEFSLGPKGAASFNYKYLTRDGGQKVNDGVELYSIVGQHRLDTSHD